MKELILDICGIKIKIRTELAIHISVYSKYANFISRENSFDYLIDTKYRYNTNAEMPADLTAASLNGNIIRIDKPDVSGYFDLCKKSGFFSLLPNIHSLESLLRAFLSIFMTVELEGFLLHSSSIKLDNRGYVFTGVSGSGKSTVVNLGENFSVLSDEIVAIRKYKGKFCTFGTPFMSKFVFGGLNDMAPIESLFFLNKAQKNYKIPINGANALNRLMPNILFFAKGAEMHSRLLELAHHLLQSVSFYELYFRKDGDITEIIKK